MMTADEFEARARREASTLLAGFPVMFTAVQHNALHEALTLHWMRAYRDGMADTADDFRRLVTERDAAIA